MSEWWEDLKVNVIQSKHAIEKEIKKKRKQLIKTAKKYGFTDERTLKSSQELDYLLNKYQRFFRTPKIRECPVHPNKYEAWVKRHHRVSYEKTSYYFLLLYLKEVYIKTRAARKVQPLWFIFFR